MAYTVPPKWPTVAYFVHYLLNLNEYLRFFQAIIQENFTAIVPIPQSCCYFKSPNHAATLTCKMKCSPLACCIAMSKRTNCKKSAVTFIIAKFKSTWRQRVGTCNIKSDVPNGQHFSGWPKTSINYINKNLSYRRDSARRVKRLFMVTQGHPLLCQSTRHIWLPIITQ